MSVSCRILQHFFWLDPNFSHPLVWLNVSQPILDRWNPPQVLFNVLFPNKSYRNFTSIGVGNYGSKDFLRHEDAFGMMTHCPMAEICHETLALIKPRMNFQIIFRFSAPLFDGRNCVMVWMCHFFLLIGCILLPSILFLQCDNYAHESLWLSRCRFSDRHRNLH